MAFNFNYSVPQFITGPLTTGASLWGASVQSQNQQGAVDYQADLMLQQKRQNEMDRLAGAVGGVGSAFGDAYTAKRTKKEDQASIFQQLLDRTSLRETGLPHDAVRQIGYDKLNTMSIAEQNAVAGQWGMTAATPEVGFTYGRQLVRHGAVSQDHQNQIAARRAVAQEDAGTGAILAQDAQRLQQFGGGNGTHDFKYPNDRKRYDQTRAAHQVAIEKAPDLETQTQLTNGMRRALNKIVGNSELKAIQQPPQDFDSYLKSIGGFRVTTPSGEPTNWIVSPNRKTGKTDYQEIKPKKGRRAALTPIDKMQDPRVWHITSGDPAPQSLSTGWEYMHVQRAPDGTAVRIDERTRINRGLGENGVIEYWDPDPDGEGGQWKYEQLKAKKEATPDKPDVPKPGTIYRHGIPISVTDDLKVKNHYREALVKQRPAYETKDGKRVFSHFEPVPPTEAEVEVATNAYWGRAAFERSGAVGEPPSPVVAPGQSIANPPAAVEGQIPQAQIGATRRPTALLDGELGIKDNTSEKSITVTDRKLNGGAPTNIPSLVNGLSPEQEAYVRGGGMNGEIQRIAIDRAIQRQKETGQRYKSYGSIKEAVAAAKRRSDSGEAGQGQSAVQPIGISRDNTALGQAFANSPKDVKLKPTPSQAPPPTGPARPARPPGPACR